MERAELKRLAKEQIKGNIGILFVISLLIGLIGGLAGVIPVGGIIVSVILTPAFGLAQINIYLRLTKGQKPAVGDLFSEFSNFWAAFKVNFLMGLFTFLWMLLLYIPGIIKMLSYSQAMYILAENPEMGALEAISRSKAMMKGHKWELFVLTLSFMGWLFLGVLTLGIGFIWIVPYMNATLANFHNSINSDVVVEG